VKIFLPPLPSFFSFSSFFCNPFDKGKPHGLNRPPDPHHPFFQDKRVQVPPMPFKHPPLPLPPDPALFLPLPFLAFPGGIARPPRSDCAVGLHQVLIVPSHHPRKGPASCIPVDASKAAERKKVPAKFPSLSRFSSSPADILSDAQRDFLFPPSPPFPPRLAEWSARLVTASRLLPRSLALPLFTHPHFPLRRPLSCIVICSLPPQTASPFSSLIELTKDE